MPVKSSRVFFRTESYRGLLFPKFCDVDVSSYRNGILEFVRERLGGDRFFVSANQIEPMPGLR